MRVWTWRFTVQALVFLAFALGGCGGDAAVEAATTGAKIESAARECQDRHEGALAPFVIGNGSYGKTSAVGVLCKDGAVVVRED